MLKEVLPNWLKAHNIKSKFDLNKVIVFKTPSSHYMMMLEDEAIPGTLANTPKKSVRLLKKAVSKIKEI